MHRNNAHCTDTLFTPFTYVHSWWRMSMKHYRLLVIQLKTDQSSCRKTTISWLVYLCMCTSLHYKVFGNFVSWVDFIIFVRLSSYFTIFKTTLHYFLLLRHWRIKISRNPLTVKFSDANVHMCRKHILQTNHTIYTYRTIYILKHSL